MTIGSYNTWKSQTKQKKPEITNTLVPCYINISLELKETEIIKFHNK